jgi:hypothetical protein
LERFDLWEKFPFGGFADDHEERDQIAAAALRRGSQHFGRDLRGEEVLVIGDTPLDIRCGRAIGAKVLAVATGGATLEELERHNPDWAVPDLTHSSTGSRAASPLRSSLTNWASKPADSMLGNKASPPLSRGGRRQRGRSPARWRTCKASWMRPCAKSGTCGSSAIF